MTTSSREEGSALTRLGWAKSRVSRFYHLFYKTGDSDGAACGMSTQDVCGPIDVQYRPTGADACPSCKVIFASWTGPLVRQNRGFRSPYTLGGNPHGAPRGRPLKHCDD